jgi:hypothetical protein
VKSDLISSTASGFFSLIYEDESTPILSSVASTYDVKQALESISSIDAVVVSRDWSYEQLEGCYLDINENDLYATFSDSSSSDCYAQVYLGDRIRLDDVWYTIYALSSTKIWLGLPDDYTIRSSYNNTDITDLPLYIWSAGYEWSITFVSPSNPSSLLQSPAHGLTPYDAIVEIRPEDCDKCIYIDDLTVWTDYYFRGRYHNLYGYGSYGSIVPSTPKRIPGVPTDTSLSVISATELEVFFSPPSLPDDPDDIVKYTVQWDLIDDFTNATSDLASCSSGNFGECNVTGSSIVGTPPYDYLIEGLSSGVTYYVRVAARNSIEPQQIDPSGNPPDNTNWSGTMNAVLSDQPPSAPVSVTGTRSGPN